MSYHPCLRLHTTQSLVKWAGASGDYNLAHYEDSFAKKAGQNRAFVPDELKRAWLVQLVVDGIGDPGRLRKLGCQFRAVEWPRLMETMTEPRERDVVVQREGHQEIMRGRGQS